MALQTTWFFNNLRNSGCLIGSIKTLLNIKQVWIAIGFLIKLLFSGYYENCTWKSTLSFTLLMVSFINKIIHFNIAQLISFSFICVSSLRNLCQRYSMFSLFRFLCRCAIYLNWFLYVVAYRGLDIIFPIAVQVMCTIYGQSHPGSRCWLYKYVPFVKFYQAKHLWYMHLYVCIGHFNHGGFFQVFYVYDFLRN